VVGSKPAASSGQPMRGAKRSWSARPRPAIFWPQSIATSASTRPISPSLISPADRIRFCRAAPPSANWSGPGERCFCNGEWTGQKMPSRRRIRSAKVDRHTADSASLRTSPFPRAESRDKPDIAPSCNRVSCE